MAIMSKDNEKDLFEAEARYKNAFKVDSCREILDSYFSLRKIKREFYGANSKNIMDELISDKKDCKEDLDF